MRILLKAFVNRTTWCTSLTDTQVTNGALCCKCGQVSTVTWELRGNSLPYKSGYACLRFPASAVGVCLEVLIYIETENSAEQRALLRKRGCKIHKVNGLASVRVFVFGVFYDSWCSECTNMWLRVAAKSWHWGFICSQFCVVLCFAGLLTGFVRFPHEWNEVVTHGGWGVKKKMIWHFP